MKQVARDFSDIYLGLDTKFGRTFIDLFRRPEAVINGYIYGRRVNYMDAIRYLLLAVFMTGIYSYFLKSAHIYEDMMAQQQALYEDLNYSQEQIRFTQEFNDRYVKFLYDFQGFFLMLTIPVLALVARFSFWGKRYYNFTEQLVFFMYTYSHAVLTTTPFSLLLLLIYPEYTIYVGTITLPLMYLYNAYCYKQCFRLSNTELLNKTLLSLVIGFAVIIALTVIGMLTGVLLALLFKT
ncbi:DUF3667 domain-containing protein [Nonlabens xiamenensis]|uniref:DUF3667 domain-containing protein n=1 Tax=Nonlabens xiamenensis TaxID=2341043 RepID=UPI001F0C0A1A|nr:DUF3667 domain-containing protein [Nonlabens xiamenensis]